ncbi:hypothetical protein [Kutzneria sp. CA-103260]|uniref:hypothetical protein n=1 Tax=Kutzneria sp. CA-103260 TaxID=2802641 RepID=UPI001BA92DBB|nr:hypothetical protein [Kutzneria sp. CA-103260]QUQ64954.1 hypothetical protein JJ691_26750 [Kutzneria sp. CA-103260]
MRYLGYIALGLGLPLGFVACVLALGWDVFDGPGAPWNWLLGAVIIVAGGLVCFWFWLFMVDHGTDDGGSLVFGVAAAVILVAGLIGVNQWLLAERGRDVACRVTSITERSDDDGSWFEYGLHCDGGQPSMITNPSRYDDVEQGQRISIRYDPVGNAVPTLTRDVADPHTALTIAAYGIGATLLLGLFTALQD